MRFSSFALSSLSILMIASASATQVHPIWGPVRQSSPTPAQGESSLPSPPIGASQQPSPPLVSDQSGERYGAFQDRVCIRVADRFAREQVMLERIDRRLLRRFGFICSYGTQATRETSSSPSTGGVAILTASLDPFGSVGDVVPRGATNVVMLSVDFTASCSRSITMDTLSVVDMGVGLPSDIFAVWLRVGGERVSRARTLLRDKTVSLGFRRPLVIEACATQTVEVIAAFSEFSLIGGRHSFVIDSQREVSADAVVVGSFPLYGEMFEVGTALTGKINVEYKSIASVARFGVSTEQVLGRFSLTVDTTEDQTLHSVTLENKGRTQDGDFVAIFLRGSIGRTPFTELAQHTRDDRVTLRFEPPFSLEKGESIDFDVVADIVGNTGSTVQMRFEEVFDLYAVGSKFGYGNNGQLYGSRVEVLGEPARVELR